MPVWNRGRIPLAYSKEEYQRNKEAHKRRQDRYRAKLDREVYLERAREATRKHRREKLQKVKLYLQGLLGGKCQNCGISDSRVLDFDHIDPASKEMLISQRYNLPIGVLEEEVRKCQLLCANCHRIKTFESGGYDSWKRRKYRNKNRTVWKKPER